MTRLREMFQRWLSGIPGPGKSLNQSGALALTEMAFRAGYRRGFCHGAGSGYPDNDLLRAHAIGEVPGMPSQEPEETTNETDDELRALAFLSNQVLIGELVRRGWALEGRPRVVLVAPPGSSLDDIEIRPALEE